MNILLKDLIEPIGIRHLIESTGGPASYYNTPERIRGIQYVVQSAIKQYPNVAHTKVHVVPNLPNAFYNFDKGEILLGEVDPVGLAHEIEHANNVKQTGLYNKVLKAAQGVARLNNIAALPTILALRTFIHNKERRNDILNTLSALSAAAVAPILVEEAQASLRATKMSPDKTKAMKTLGPAFMAHMLSNISPVLTYQTGKKL
ncbi:MAG: hypothetical protein PVI90_00320 [Desulfobacteraceae bacterium]|jgi:hypothetical protein